MQTTAYEEFPELKDFAQIIPALDSIIRYGDPLASLKWENKIICIKLSVEDDGISKKVEDDFSDYTVIE